MFGTLALSSATDFPALRLVASSPEPAKPDNRLVDGVTGSRLLTTAEAAAFLSVSPRTAETWRRTGRGPVFVAISRNAVRYRLSDLEAWIGRRAAPHTAKSRALLAA